MAVENTPTNGNLSEPEKALLFMIGQNLKGMSGTIRDLYEHTLGRQAEKLSSTVRLNRLIREGRFNAKEALIEAVVRDQEVEPTIRELARFIQNDARRDVRSTLVGKRRCSTDE